MRYPILYSILFLLVFASSCRTKKLNLKDDFTILSTSVTNQGNLSVLSGYVFNREDNAAVNGARINLIMPPLEKLTTIAILNNGYFEIALQKGKYNLEVVQGANILFHKEGLKIPYEKKVEVLIYLKN